MKFILINMYDKKLALPALIFLDIFPGIKCKIKSGSFYYNPLFSPLKLNMFSLHIK